MKEVGIVLLVVVIGVTFVLGFDKTMLYGSGTKIVISDGISESLPSSVLVESIAVTIENDEEQIHRLRGNAALHEARADNLADQIKELQAAKSRIAVEYENGNALLKKGAESYRVQGVTYSYDKLYSVVKAKGNNHRRFTRKIAELRKAEQRSRECAKEALNNAEQLRKKVRNYKERLAALRDELQVQEQTAEVVGGFQRAAGSLAKRTHTEELFDRLNRRLIQIETRNDALLKDKLIDHASTVPDLSNVSPEKDRKKGLPPLSL